ncbi:MAG: hypothetical protein M1430_03810 [Betaproteobacteria bacterium]|nr:hypothetical protein [Betaproteobacteria bacterium]
MSLFWGRYTQCISEWFGVHFEKGHVMENKAEFLRKMLAVGREEQLYVDADRKLSRFLV